MRDTLTLEDHNRIGAELYDIRNRLLKLGTEINTAMPKTAPASKAAYRPVKAIDSLRCKLDSLACSIPGGGPRVYYPGAAK